MLKRIFSSICLVLILLNVMGYYGVLVVLQSANQLEFTKRIDRGNYDRSSTHHLKQFVKTPVVQGESFNRVDGQFEHKGQLYRLIKQRVYLDTFHIVYIKDIRGTAINKVLKDYVKSFGDQPTDGDDGYVIPLFMKEYFSKAFAICSEKIGWEQCCQPGARPSVFIPSYFASIIHPPERLS